MLNQFAMAAAAASEDASGGTPEALYDALAGVSMTDTPGQTEVQLYGVGVRFEYASDGTITEVQVRDWAIGGRLGKTIQAQLWVGGSMTQSANFPNPTAGSGTTHTLSGLSWAISASTQTIVQCVQLTVNGEWGRVNNAVFNDGSGGGFSAVTSRRNQTSTSTIGVDFPSWGNYVNVIIES